MRGRFVIVVAILATLPGGAGGERSSGAVPERALDPCGARESLAAAGTAFVARPFLPLSFASAHFVVHYPDRSLDDYARDVSAAAELSYRVLVDTLRHVVPPPDGEAGGDGRIDIYLRAAAELGGAYGTTVPDSPIGTPYFNTYTSWIELSDALDESRRATVTAHEVYHVVQLGYDRRESLSLLEMFSTWFEDRVYDEANSHYIFLLQFFRRPDRGLFDQHYTNVPWAIFLTERYGDAIMAETLERCGRTPGPNPRGAFDGALQSTVGTTLSEEFVEFGLWNFFTSLRDDGAHYSEGGAYPAIRFQVRGDCFPIARHVTDHPMHELAANYFLFDGNEHRARLRVRVEPEPAATSHLTVVQFRGGVRERSTRHYTAGAAPDSFLVDDWEHCDSVLAVYQIDRGLPKDNTVAVAVRYQYDAAPTPPWVMVLDRDGCRRPFDGDADEFLARDGEETAIARALWEAGERAVVTDSLPADLRACRAVFVVGGFGDDGVTLSPYEMATLSNYMDAGGDVYLESARLGAWVDSALAQGASDLPAFWSMFGCAFQAGEDSANVAGWVSEGEVGVHSFAYDPGEPDYRVGVLLATASEVLVRDDRGLARASVRRVGTSTRVASTVLLGGSTGRMGSTRARFVADVLSMFDADGADAPVRAPLRLVATYPNPARDAADLFVQSPAAGAASVTVYDVAGRRVGTTLAFLVAGANTVRLATPRVAGVYFVVVRMGGASAHGRFLVLR